MQFQGCIRLWQKSKMTFPYIWSASDYLPTAKMASVGFRWLDILEKEFDKAFVDLDLEIGEWLASAICPLKIDGSEHDVICVLRFSPLITRTFPGELHYDEPELVYNVRQKLCTLNSCFAQLTHKAQTIFQNSAKIEVSYFIWLGFYYSAPNPVRRRKECLRSPARTEYIESNSCGNSRWEINRGWESLWLLNKQAWVLINVAIRVIIDLFCIK